MLKTSFRMLIPALILLITACTEPKNADLESQVVSDPLPSWNEGSAKSSIIAYVNATVNESAETFVPVADRIAVFDNDGTLWTEQPYYFQLAFALDQVRANADLNPEWKTTEPFKSVIDGDINRLMSQGEGALVQIIGATHGGMTADEFTNRVENWANTARHPRFDRPYTDLVFQPMLELLDYLRANDFKTFIVSGGGIAFMRPITSELYGIPPEQVVGSMIEVSYNVDDKVIERSKGLYFVDDKAGKPVGIYNFIGKKPIMAVGNSDGDLQMMEWTATNPNSFAMYIHHTDEVREWAYDSLSHIGRLKEGFQAVKEGGWTLVSMKDDWKVIYPFELGQ